MDEEFDKYREDSLIDNYTVLDSDLDYEEAYKTDFYRIETESLGYLD